MRRRRCNRREGATPRLSAAPLHLRVFVILALATVAGAIQFGSAAAGDFETGWQAYQNGDFRRAFNEWRPLAEKGDKRAQFNIGVLYDDGKALPEDRSKALDWWTKAAEQGGAQAQHNIGLAYLAGTGVRQDHAQAFFWLKKAAGQGLMRSQYALGRMFDYGFGVEKDPGEAAKWVGMAAERGFDKAQYNLGKRYRDGGGGVPHDDRLATKWFEAAAKQGHARAQQHLGARYRTGTGVDRNLAAAYMWFILAIRPGNSAALKNRDSLAAELSAADRANAEELAEAWHPTAASISR